ncbi:MAG: response regulator [Acidobacteria bacterium]|nr:MAG: response regulator [Acidobacteriota bacterium]
MAPERPSRVPEDQRFASDRSSRSVQPKKVLVVDDSKLIHKMFEVMLRSYALVHAMDGREGLERLHEHPDIDLILLDINMPSMNGFEFLEEVKRSEAFTEVPVIIVSTEGKDQDTVRGLQAGAAAYIKKPFRNEEILKLIERLPPMASD